MHPDPQFAEYILAGIQYGFRIGFSRSACKLRDCGSNMISAMEHPQVVGDYLANEIGLQRMNSIPSAALSSMQCHIKWRLIVDLSSPQGFSVNDGIDKQTCSVSYVSIDDVVSCILELGQGAEMAKIYIKQAYRNIPVHPNDRGLLCVQWGGKVLVDKVLPFGLR